MTHQEIRHIWIGQFGLLAPPDMGWMYRSELESYVRLPFHHYPCFCHSSSLLWKARRILSSKICALKPSLIYFVLCFHPFFSDGFFFQLIPMFKSLLPYNPSLALDFTFPLKNSLCLLLWSSSHFTPKHSIIWLMFSPSPEIAFATVPDNFPLALSSGYVSVII